MRRLSMVIVLAFAVAAHAVTLVQDGEPNAVIVLSKDPGPVAFEAAHELQRVIERISGAQLPIYLENEWHGGLEGPRSGAPRIFVGDSQTAREAGFDPATLPAEGFIVKTVTFSPKRPSPEDFVRPAKNTHPALIIAGDDRPVQNWSWRGDRSNRYLRGTTYAVYDFLEKELGVRWLWPGELGEVVPQMTTITVGDIDRADAPELVKRIIRNSSGYWTGGRWTARRRVGTPTVVWTRLAHVSDQWVDHLRFGDSTDLFTGGGEGVVGWVEKYGDDHPEWFAMQPGGERLVKENYGRVRLCLSNPQVIDKIAEEACAAFDADPDKLMYGIELSDVFGSYCVCDNCKAWGPTVSDLVARHWNAVAKKVAQRHPDKLLYAHPYHAYIDSPQTVTRIADNIMLFPVGKNTSGYTAEPDRDASRKSWVGWAKLNKQPMVWRPNYPCDDVGLPLNYTHRLAEDIRLFHAHKLIGADVDHMRRNWSGGGLNFFVLARLLWDPDTDVDAVIDDYCEKGFATAASAMRAYFDEVEALTTRIAEHESTGRHPMGLGESSGFGLAWHYTPAVTGKLNALLDAARDAAGGDQAVINRIEFVRVAVTYARIEHETNMIGRRADKAELSPGEIEQIRTQLTAREAFIKGQVGTFHLEPEVCIGGADWVERILKDQEQAQLGRGLFDDLQLTHEEIVTLPSDGWLFKTDLPGAGVKERWFARHHDESDWKPIKVGEFWEKQGWADYNGTGWYRRRVTLPKSLQGKRVIFSFGAADESALVFIDGEAAGEYDIGPIGWDQRFELDFTDHVKPGVEQQYAIRVIDTTGAGGLWKPIKVFTPRARGRTSTVELPASRDTWIRRNFADITYGKSNTLAVGSKDYFRTLVSIDLPNSLRQTRITSAKLVFALRYSNGGRYAAYPITHDWHERTVTWNRRHADHQWDGTPGGGPLPGSAIAHATLTTVTAEQVEKAEQPPTAVFDLSLYLNKNVSKLEQVNLLIVQEPASPDANFSSHAREAEDASVRPKLVVEYQLD